MWKKGDIKSNSEQRQKEIPGLIGFSASSIRNMLKFDNRWLRFLMARLPYLFAKSTQKQELSQ